MGTLSITPHCDKLSDCCQDCFLTAALTSPINRLPLLESAKTWLKEKKSNISTPKKVYLALTVAIRGARVLSLGCFTASQPFVPIASLMQSGNIQQSLQFQHSGQTCCAQDQWPVDYSRDLLV